MDHDPRDVIGVYLTFPDAATAEAIGAALLAAGLAACVNLFAPVTSLYRWEGALQRDPEVVAWAKTTRARLPALAALLRARHPYEVPCVVAYPVVGGDEAYLEWVRAEVGHDPVGSVGGPESAVGGAAAEGAAEGGTP